jgi:hypothetical protein
LESENDSKSCLDNIVPRSEKALTVPKIL